MFIAPALEIGRSPLNPRNLVERPHGRKGIWFSDHRGPDVIELAGSAVGFFIPDASGG
jgi:hypothetical protein